MIRAVIFDFNGVLVDDEHVHCELLREVLAEEGITITEQQYHDEYLGYDDRGCFLAALSRAGRSIAPGVVEELIERKASRYVKAAEEGLRVFPGAASAVRSLGARWPIAICSGALRGEIQFALGRMGVTELIGPIIAAEDTERCKPDPEGYLLALDALRSREGIDVEAGHCLVVEDSLAGVESAKRAGMWVVGVTHTYTDDELRRAGADVVIRDLSRLDPGWVHAVFTPEVWP